MTLERQNQIASSFSDKYEEFDEKWDIFVIDENMYWSRSWTGSCIYKVNVFRNDNQVTLTKALVTRDPNQYRSNNIIEDRILLLKMIQFYLGRDDIYIDPAFEYDLIKAIVKKLDPERSFIKSIGRGNDVSITKKIYRGLVSPDSQDYYRVVGWDELEKTISSRPENEKLLTLYIHDKQTNSGTTFYFNNEVTELLGQVTVNRIK
jgi:hypothetical protein